MVTQNSKFKISDQRKSHDYKQILLLKEELEKEKLYSKLQKSKSFLGRYSLKLPYKIGVRVIDGKLGEGEVKNKAIQIQLPPTAKAIQQLKETLGLYFSKLTDENYRKIVLALATSTIFHEAIHILFDSRPGSKLAVDFEQISGLQNAEGKVSTLLDEGLVYAIQGIYSKNIKPIGSLKPEPKKSDSQIVKIRKRLGKRLIPKTKIYFQNDRRLDNAFLSFAAKQINELVAYL